MSIGVNALLNRVALEVGLPSEADPFSSQSQHFQQMVALLDTCGEELTMAHTWNHQVKEHNIITGALDSGSYPLPDDFHAMIDQTGWERGENVPLFGPLSAQDWTYLLGRDLVSYTIYASFRIKEGTFNIFPQPPPAGLDINFEYQSRYWLDGTTKETPTSGGDVVDFNKTLITRFLKLKWMEAKGFDTNKPADDFNMVLQSITGKDKGAEILSAGRNARAFPYLDSRYNTKDSGYGL